MRRNMRIDANHKRIGSNDEIESERTLVVINSKNDTDIVLGEDEKKVILFTKGAKSGTVRLAGSGAEAIVVGLVVGRAEEESELDVKIIHDAPETKADIILRGVVYDKAKVVIKGSVVIPRGAKKSEDALREDLLLVGENAKGETYPYLEIEENDVMAKHAATVGQIDREQVFYLAARGIGQDQAEAMIIEGFMKAVLEVVPMQLRDKMGTEI